MGKFSYKIAKALCGIDIDGLNNELEKLKLENETLQNELDKANKDRDVIAASAETLKTESKTLKAEIETITAERQSLNAESKELRTENERLKADYESLKIELETLKADNLEISSKHDSEKEENNSLVKSLKEENEKINTELEDCKKRFEEELAKDKEFLAVANNNLAEKSKSLDAALNEIQNLKKGLEEISVQKDSAEESLKTLSQEHESFKGAYAEKEELLRKSQNKLIELEKALSEKESEQKKNLENKEIKKASKPEPIKPERPIEKNKEEQEKEELNNNIVSLTKKYEYVRVTTKLGNQYIFEAKHLQLKAGLFDWGIEGNEVITDELLFLTHEDVKAMEGLDSPFASEELVCDLSNEENAQQLVETLLTAICTYQPLQINYHDKNGRTTTKNLFHVSFQPTVSKFKLPYKDLFKDMLEENFNTDHLSAMCPHNPEPRTFAISQIETIRRFDAYFTTKEGIETMKNGIKLANDSDQPEMAEILSSKLPR